jgi:Protein of unknown function (DUF2911)
MKKILLISLGVLFTLVVGVALYGALVVSKRSPISTATISDQGLDIKVTYCQPYKKGRLIFGEEKDGALQPYGKYWRMGANAATEITFSKNANFGGKAVNAGSYRMYAVPGPDSFQLSLNSELGVYFAIREPDYAKDIVKVDVPVTAAPTETEQFTISFGSDSTGVKMNLIWDKTQVTVPITAQ